MKCQVTIRIEGQRSFSRRYAASNYTDARVKGRLKAVSLTPAAPCFSYTLEYAAGGVDWRIIETGNQDDLIT